MQVGAFPCADQKVSQSTNRAKIENMIRPRVPALLRVANAILDGFTDRGHARSDATPPAANLHTERPWVSPPRPPWVRRHDDARALLARFFDDMANAVAPPPAHLLARRLDTPRGGATSHGGEDDDE